jgi:hypothetical protein
LLLAGTLALAILADVDEAIPNVYILQAAGCCAIEALGASEGASANSGGLGAEAPGDAVFNRRETAAVYAAGWRGEPPTRATTLLGFVGLGIAGYRRANKHRIAVGSSG